jgi:hypothetical protein
MIARPARIAPRPRSLTFVVEIELHDRFRAARMSVSGSVSADRQRLSAANSRRSVSPPKLPVSGRFGA